MSTSSHPATPQRLALAIGEVASVLGISVRHAWSLNSSGRLPRPVRLGRAVRWRADELHAWLAAGAPPRDKWEAIRANTDGRVKAGDVGLDNAKERRGEN